MFYAVGPGGGGIGDRLGAVGVGGDGQAVAVGLLDGSAKLGGADIPRAHPPRPSPAPPKAPLVTGPGGRR